MPKITEEEIKKILPLKGPSFEEVKNYLEKYRLIKEVLAY